MRMSDIDQLFIPISYNFPNYFNIEFFTVYSQFNKLLDHFIFNNSFTVDSALNMLRFSSEYEC